MKNSIPPALGLAIGICLAVMLPARAQWVRSDSPNPQISLSGSAEVKVAPDEIILSVGVETRNENLEPARLENDRKIAATLAFLKQSGIKSKDIQMDYINVQPDYDNNVSRVRPVAYTVHKDLEVRLKDVTRFQDVLTGMLTNGVNYVNNIDFRTTELRKYRDQARAMAVRAAREKAGAITSELGVKLGKVSGITLNDYGIIITEVTTASSTASSTTRSKTWPPSMKPRRTRATTLSPPARSASPQP